MNEKILIDCGLTPEQAKIYIYLIENGFSPAKVISAKTGIGRALTYKVLDQLSRANLVEKREDIGKIALFGPGHPQKVTEMLETRRKKLEEVSHDASQVINVLSSQYNALVGKPNVQSFEGVEGMKKVHEAILSLGKDISVISSPISFPSREDILLLIEEQVKKQVKNNIHTRAITPRSEVQKERLVAEKDIQNLIERKVIPANKLNLPAQIIIFGDKVAITNFKESLITVIIESKNITETFQTIFEYLWSA